jgi:tetratricopeptide (TPR) repeat protein
MTKGSSRNTVVASVIAAFLSACGPPAGNQIEVGEPIPVKAPPKTEVPPTELTLDAQALQGVLFDPDALAIAEMPAGYGMAVKKTIDQQRKLAKGKGAKAAQQKYELALLLWYTPGTGKPKQAKQQQLAQRGEALGILTELASEKGASEEVLWAYAVAEQAVGDPAKAQPAWDALIAKYPQSKNMPRFQALRDYLDLKNHKPLTFPLPASLEGAPYEAAYVASWTAFRGGDKAGAQAALKLAVTGWTNLETVTFLRRDILVIMSRTGAAPADAVALLQDACKKDNAACDKVIANLPDAYTYAGEYGAAAEVYDTLSSGAQPDVQAQYRAVQAVAYYRLLQPDKSAEALVQSWTTLASSTTVDPQIKEAVAKRVGDFAVYFHADYAKTHDPRFIEPAKKLYSTYLAIQPPRPDAETIKTKNIPGLDETVKQCTDTKAPGAFDEQTAKHHLGLYLEQIGACYELALQSDPTLTIAENFVITIGADGKITDAKAGDDATGKCLVERAKEWLFPATGVVTKVTYPVKFSPKGAEPAAAPAAAAPAAATPAPAGGGTK